jgi:AcrR family transcriptional regulator
LSPKPDVTEQRRHQILDAATKVFTRKGIDKTRMDDIVDETGLSKGALYWYFKGKDDIVISILDRIFQRELGELEAMDLDQETALGCIWEYTGHVIDDLVVMLKLMPIAYEFFSLATRSKVVQKALTNYFRRYMDVLVPIVEFGIERGEFRPVDPNDIAIAAGAIFEGTILLWVYDRNLVDPERHIRSGIQLLMEGVLVKKQVG